MLTAQSAILELLPIGLEARCLGQSRHFGWWIDEQQEFALTTESSSDLKLPTSIHIDRELSVGMKIIRISSTDFEINGNRARISKVVDTPCLEKSKRIGLGTQVTALSQKIGQGTGLTPFYDDVLAGYLLMTNPNQIPNPRIWSGYRTTTFSKTLLDLAARGYGVDAAVSYAENQTIEAANQLRDWGSTSGLGILTGIDLVAGEEAA